MATTERLIDAPAESVFHVLADPESYAHWVVGANEIRAYDDDWPRVGATFHHTQGKWPLSVKDSSSVIEAEPELTTHLRNKLGLDRLARLAQAVRT